MDIITNNDYQKFIVQPSIPILWFGDKPAYHLSNLKIVTVGLNPSDEEFPLQKTDNYYRFPDYKGDDTLEISLNNYFEKYPYRSWFESFEPILNGLQASYYSKTKMRNRALHTDICSPWATNPTWSKLSPEYKQRLYKEGHQQWIDLINELQPDLMLISVAKNHLANDFTPDGNWTIISTDKNGQTREPYKIEKYYYQSSNKKIAVAFGQASQKPFGVVGKNQKKELGELILDQIKDKSYDIR